MFSQESSLMRFKSIALAKRAKRANFLEKFQSRLRIAARSSGCSSRIRERFGRFSRARRTEAAGAP